MVELLYLPKWSKIITEIYKTPEHYRYCQKINRGVKASLNHLRTVIKLLETAQLIEIVPTKKIKRINLTEKGKRVAVYILNIESEIR